MKIIATGLQGVFLVEVSWRKDDRGEFGRAWTADDLKSAGLRSDFAQSNISRTRQALTMRGLHWQLPPEAEAKFLRVVRGAVFDVCVDVRPASKTAGQWFGRKLTAERDVSIYVGEGLAHGFLTLEDDTEVHYLSTRSHAPDFERGLCWNDVSVGIVWPETPLVVSAKDGSWPDLAATLKELSR